MRKSSFIALILFFVIVLFLFKDFILHSHIPFPGDLLISEYSPFKYESYLGYNPGSYPNKAQYFDVVRQMTPWKSFVIESFQNASIPFWNPYNFAGAPLLANNQSAPFYPFNFLFFILPFTFSWSIFLALQMLLAGIFTYIFARQLKISYIPAFVSGAMYGMGLFMSTFFEYGIVGHTILWLPLALYSFEKLSSKFSYTFLTTFVLSVIFSLLAGHMQVFFLSFGFTILYILMRLYVFKSEKKSYLILLVPMASIGICAILLRHTFELISYAARVPHTHEALLKFLIQPSELILLISPDFFGNPVSRNYLLDGSYPGNAVYVGVVGIFFATYAISHWKKNSYTKIFITLLFLSMVFLTKNPLSSIFYKIPIDFITSSSPSNGLFIISFILSILAGFGMDRYIKEKISIKKILMIISLFVIIAIVALISHESFIQKSLMYTVGLFGMLLIIIFVSGFNKLVKKYSVIAMVLLLVVDLSYFFLKFNPFSPREFMYPPHEVLGYIKENAGINRVWGYGFAALDSNIETYYGIYSPNGYDPLYPRWYGEFIHSSIDGKILNSFDGTTRSNALIAPGFGEEDLMQNSQRLRVLDSLGVKYIIDRVENGSSERTFSPDRFEKVYGKNNWFVYENKFVAPRIFFTNTYTWTETHEDFEKTFFSEQFDPARAIILQGRGQSSSGSAVVSEIIELKYEPNRISFRIEAPTDGYVFISDTYYPRWEVEKPGGVEILRANHAFRAIPVLKGQHNIQLKYKGGVRTGNLGDMLSLGISISSVIILILYGFIWNYKKK